MLPLNYADDLRKLIAIPVDLNGNSPYEVELSTVWASIRSCSPCGTLSLRRSDDQARPTRLTARRSAGLPSLGARSSRGRGLRYGGRHHGPVLSHARRAVPSA